MDDNDQAEMESLRLLWETFGPDCGSHSCVFARVRSGQRTNGGCRCLEHIELEPQYERVRYLVAARIVYQARAARRVCRQGSVCGEACNRNHHGRCSGAPSGCLK